MKRSDMKVYVAGHRGMVGSALVESLRAAGYHNIVVRSREELDLLDQRSVHQFLCNERPEYVFVAAARVGGIQANNTYRADFIYENLAIATNLIHGSHLARVPALMFLGSSCVYPRECSQPIKEEFLLTGSLEQTNEPYAVAKIAGIKLCEGYRSQYGRKYLSVMPTNLFGPGDNYDLETSHVLPALIRKAHEAKCRSDDSIIVWGTGNPRREFLYVDDLADACVRLMKLQMQEDIGELPSLINIGTGSDLTIRELAEEVMEVVGFHGRIVFDPSMPDGTPRKLLDIARIRELGWSPKVTLREGIRRSYDSYLRHLRQ